MFYKIVLSLLKSKSCQSEPVEDGTIKKQLNKVNPSSTGSDWQYKYDEVELSWSKIG